MIDRIEISYAIPAPVRTAETEKACEDIFERVYDTLKKEILMMPKAAVVVLRKAGVEERL